MQTTKFEHNLVRKQQKIGHSLECEGPKFGYNPAREPNKIWAQFCGRSMKTWAQICLKTQFLFSIRAGRHVNRAGRKGVRARRNTYLVIDVDPACVPTTAVVECLVGLYLVQVHTSLQ